MHLIRPLRGSRGLPAVLRGRRWLAIQRFPVPTMGDSITEGTLLEVSKSVGDHVGMEEVIASIETDKVTVEVRSPAEGKITAIFSKPDENVLVGADFIEIDVGVAGSAGGEVQTPPPSAAAETTATDTANISAAAPSSRRTHPSGRSSLIGFPPRGALAAMASAPSPAATPSATAAPPAAAQAQTLSATSVDQLPERFRKLPISEEEMECIDMGGAGYLF